jgi:hypothetical protein
MPPKPTTIKKKTLYYDKRNGCLKIGDTRMRGVCDLIKHAFTEPLRQDDRKSFKKEEFAPQVSEKHPPVAISRASSESNRKLSSYQKQLSGFSKGRYIHSQIEKLTSSRASSSSTKKRNICIHPQSERVFELLQQLKLDIKGSEFGVWWDVKRIATPLDMLTTNRKTGRYVPIEIKTGYHTIGYTAPKYRLRGAKFRYRYCSERDLHFMQLLVGTILLNHSHPNAKVDPMGSLLIQIPDSSVARADKIPLWLCEARSSVESVLAKS